MQDSWLETLLKDNLQGPCVPVQKPGKLPFCPLDLVQWDQQLLELMHQLQEVPQPSFP
jgi:hypothetical protein